jgi:hypothetical protein
MSRPCDQRKRAGVLRYLRTSSESWRFPGIEVSGDWFVIPGSGTGQLAGLRGTGGFRAGLGEGTQAHLAYWFE